MESDLLIISPYVRTAFTSSTETHNEIQRLSLKHKHTHTQFWALITHMQNDSFLQQALFFGSHHKVVRVILVVDNVFQVNT